MKGKQQTCSPPGQKDKNSTRHHNKPVHKEFQLLYRTRGGQPSSEQYESVIFMKHQHISPHPAAPKQKQKKSKKVPKQKKKTDESRKNIKLDEKTEQKFYPSAKLGSTKSTVPFMTEGNFANTRLFSESFRENIDMSKTKIRKIGNLSNDNSSRYLDSKYITKNQKKKVKNDKSSKSIEHPKTAKPSSRGHSKLVSPKSALVLNKKNNIPEHEANEAQYIFINGEFVKASNQIFAQIQKKILNEQQLQRNQFLQSYSLIQKGVEMDPSESCEFSRPESIAELSTIKSFINFKVIKIQRWWRSILRTRTQNNYADEQIINQQVFKSQNISEQNLPDSCSNIAPEINLSAYLQYHENTVMNYMNSQKNILMKLKQNNKITEQHFVRKFNEIESNFQKQILTLNQMRENFDTQITKIKYFEEKISEQNSISERIGSMNAEDVARFFSKDNKENVDSKIHQDFIHSKNHTKQKSNGCHFSDETQQIQVVIPSEREVFEKDSSDENSQNNKPQDEDQEVELSSAIQDNFQNLVEVYQDQQKAQAEIEKRYAIQVGMMVPDQQKNSGINTSVMAVHKFLTNFLKFYQYFYRDQFLKLVNMPYGQNPKNRLKNLQKSEEGEQLQYEQDGIIYGLSQIISAQALEDYHEHNYNNLDMSDQNILMMVCYDKIHNKAMIDCFNECINQFRPYYYVNGPPYLWNYSEKALTFYFIAQENTQEVFEKTQYKVLRNASSLCGMLVNGLSSPVEASQDENLTDLMIEYRSCVNPLLMQSRQQKLSKVEKLQIEQGDYQWHTTEQQRTSSLIDVSNVLLIQLVLEACCELSYVQE